jgi:hypothetical protein
MNSSPTDAQQQALYKAETLEGLEAYAAAGLGPSDAGSPPTEPATLVTR